MTAQQPQRRPHSWHQPRPHPRSPDDVHDAIPEADPENASADAPSPPKPKLAVVPYNTSLIEVLRQPVESALSAAVAGHQVVYNLATAIPTGEHAGRRSAWNDNHRIRREGARNLVDAALHAGADRYIQESISFLYADGGDEYLDESAAVDPTWITEPALVAEAEAARFAEHGGAGIALRFGILYGFDSAHTVEAVHAAQRGLFALPGPAGSYWPSVTTDDAASAAAAALRAPSGVYNIADDRPLRRAEHAEALAEALGTGPLTLPPVSAGFPQDLSMMLRSQRVTSQRFKALTDWQPRLPSAWEGWRFVVAELRQRHVAKASDRSAKRSTRKGLDHAIPAPLPLLPREES